MFQNQEGFPLSRESAAYKAALEIELWKEIAQQEYSLKLQRQEENLLDQLSANFQDEHGRISNEISSTKRAYEELLKQYKTKLLSLEKREKKHIQQSSAFERTFESFSKERTSKLDDIKQKSSHRSEFLCIELDTVIQRIANAERLNSRLSHRIEEIEKAISFKELEFNKTLHVGTSEVSLSLQNELFDVKTAYTAAKEKLSKLTTSKEKYKMKLKSVLDELSKSRHPTTGSCGQYPPIHHAHTTQHQKPFTTNKSYEKSDFSDIKSELNSIISDMSQIPERPQAVPDYQVESEIAKLISERNTLLNTGVYMAEDFIIKKIDSKIKKLLPLEKRPEHGFG